MKPFEHSLGSSPTITGARSSPAEVLGEGTVLGNYRIVRFLGAGGMGAVYIAEHIYLKTRHALKTIRPELSKQSGFESRFLREARLTAHLKHPHIVPCTDAGVANGTPYLVMDYIEGPAGEPLNLRQLLDQRRERGELLDEDEAAAVGLEICKALDYAHSYRDAEIPNGIIHRDLKPANILLDKDTKLYISDFGLARLVGEKFEESVVRAHALSRSLGDDPTLRGGKTSTSSDAVGTFDYMSPEQREGRTADTRSDVFAMGAILYELLTGRKVVGMPAPPCSVRPELMPKWDEILERALAYAPDERFATAGDLRRAIEGVSAQSYIAPDPAMLDAAGAAAAWDHAVEEDDYPARLDATGTATRMQLPAPRTSADTPKPTLGNKEGRRAWIIAASITGLLIIGGLIKWLPCYDQTTLPSEQKPVNGLPPSTPLAATVPSSNFITDGQSHNSTLVQAKPVTPIVVIEHKEGQSLVLDLGGSVTLEMVWIPPGEFLMGSPLSEERLSNDESQHRVMLSKGFWLGRTEVTQVQWERVMGNNPSSHKGVTLPVEKVSWNDCQGFIEKLNQRFGTVSLKARLPTEAEWEYACRGGTQTRFHTGDTDADLARAGWFSVNGRYEAHEVGRKEANSWGLYDMHGNVAEWCQDWYGPYDSTLVRDPLGPKSGSYRVLRGGSWANNSVVCRSAMRYWLKPDFCLNSGLRVVVTMSSDVPTSVATSTQKSIQREKIGANETNGIPIQITQFENTLGMKFLPIPGTLVLFGKFEVTNAEYRKFKPAHNSGEYGGRTLNDENQPVVNVSWDDAKAFCSWLTEKEQRAGLLSAGRIYRLPFDWEWSAAVGLNEPKEGEPKEKSGKIKDAYPWGNCWPPYGNAGNFADVTAKQAFNNWTTFEGYNDGYAASAPVGSFRMNPKGLYDMGGNVWQWCEDLYVSDQKTRVLRGCSWVTMLSPNFLLLSNRDHYLPNYRYIDIGFRMVIASAQ